MGFIPAWALGVGVIILAGSIGRAVTFMIKARSTRDADEQVSELRQALDVMQRRVGELEERVDFAERLLAKPRE
jgi:hypothetical protein